MPNKPKQTHDNKDVNRRQKEASTNAGTKEDTVDVRKDAEKSVNQKIRTD